MTKRKTAAAPAPDAALHNPDPTYVRELLARAGVSQRDAARRVGVSERSMRGYVAEAGTPTAQPIPYPVQYALECLAYSIQSGRPNPAS